MDEPPLTPTRHTRTDLQRLTKAEIVQRMLDLEAELNEFQASSRDLEQALEDELQALELRNAALLQALSTKEEQLAAATKQNQALVLEIDDLNGALAKKTRAQDDELRRLQLQLVLVEISNDAMELHDRVLSSRLEVATQFNNELLEKLALVENDLELERRLALEARLHISNYQNNVRELTNKVTALEARLQASEAPQDPDGTVLSMRDILSSGPPIAPGMPGYHHMPKSDSLKRLHDLTTKSEKMSIQIQSLNSFYQMDLPLLFKLPSTTQVTHLLGETRTSRNVSGASNARSAASLASLAATSSEKETSPPRRGISPSPSFMNLSEKVSQDDSPTKTRSRPPLRLASGTSTRSTSSGSKRRLAQVASMSKLESIKGSPNPLLVVELAPETLQRNHSKKKSGLFESLKMSIRS